MALELHLTVGELMQRMNAQEYNQWLAFFALRAEDASGETKKKAELAALGFELED